MLVATAGHIDHGKTALVRALTGVETDRLPEEQARGISIELGFAYWQTQDGGTIGFVDVPGHERYIRNMVAGVSAVDFALLVIAADDGVMPQSIEHLQIIMLMGIERGFVALTKCDRVSAARITQVRGEIELLLAGTALAGARVFEVSSISGAGITKLGDALQAQGRSHVRTHTGTGNFRLAIDRAFTVPGAGTVVTGTVVDGAVASGDRLVLAPSGTAVRVRTIQCAGTTVARAIAGERCALNLAGVDLSEVHRGDWLVVAAMLAPTALLDAEITVLPSEPKPLRHNTEVHLHLGTTRIAARVFIAGQRAIAPGETAFVKLALDHSICAVNADRLVLRDHAGQRTIGGGRVLDIVSHRRRRAARDPLLAAMQHRDPASALAALLTIAGHEVDRQHFELCYNLAPDHAAAIYRAADAHVIGKQQSLILPRQRIDEARAELPVVISDFHQAEPEAAGIRPQELRARLSTGLSPAVFQHVLRAAADERQVELEAGLVRLPGHDPGISALDIELWRKVVRWLEDRGLQPFTAADMARELRISAIASEVLLGRRVKDGDVCRLGEGGYLLREQLAELAACAAALARAVGGQGFTAAQFRDAAGIGRNLTIKLLEYLDGIGVTTRTAEYRRIRADYQRLTGSVEF